MTKKEITQEIKALNSKIQTARVFRDIFHDLGSSEAAKELEETEEYMLEEIAEYLKMLKEIKKWQNSGYAREIYATFEHAYEFWSNFIKNFRVSQSDLSRADTFLNWIGAFDEDENEY